MVKRRTCVSCGVYGVLKTIDLCKRCEYKEYSKERVKKSGTLRRRALYHSLSVKEYLELTNKCCSCGYDLIVHIHHIIPKSKGGTNNIDNLIGLCPNCHYLLHYRGYTLDELNDIIKG